jgi:type IV secretion system protein VirB2
MRLFTECAKYGTFLGARTKENTGRKRAFFLLMVFSLLFLSGLFVVLGMAETAEAGETSSGTSMPWESPLEKISKSLTGPVARALCLIMVVVSVGVLMFGGDLAGWARSVAFMALAGGLIGGAGNFLNLLNVTGALV